MLNEKKDRLFGIWAGLMKFKLVNVNYTQDKVKLGDVIPDEAWNRKEQIVTDYYAWYNGLGNSLVDQKKNEIADQILTLLLSRSMCVMAAEQFPIH